MSIPQEIELKLGLREGAREALEAVPLLAGAPAATYHEITTYWDTKDFALAERGFALRVRKRDGNGTRRQTVKNGGERGLVARRGEWEWDVPTDAPDLALVRQVPDFPVDALPGLLPVFQVDVDRTVRTVNVAGSSIELVIDIGEIRGGRGSMPVGEAELELKSGEPIALYHLARALCDAAPLAIVAESKAERGRRVVLGQSPAWRKDRRPPLSQRISARAALRDVIGEAVGHFLENVPAVADPALGADAEGVHQARAAIRRLRAALGLFGGKDPLVDRLRERLKGVGEVLGEARDWDVFATDILPVNGDHTPPLAEPAAERRTAAHARAREMLQTTELLALLLDVLIWTEHADPPGSARKHLAARLDREARRARKRGRRVATRTTTELHALRRAIRRLRYDAEFVAGVFGPKLAKPYIKECKRLQNALGKLGDAVLAERLLQRLTPAPGDTAGHMLAWSAQIKAETARRVPHLWRRFRAADPFWR